jgi:hypothetical protein
VRWFLAGCAAVLLLSAAPDPAASMSCASAVVVDGRLLFGHGQFRAGRLPPRGRSVRAIIPGCGKDDRPTTVWTLRGLPRHIAVVRDGAGLELYVAQHSLTPLAGHPLRAVFRRRPARRGDCTPRATLRGTVTSPDGRGFGLDVSGRELYVSVDARSRIANRPAYQPVLARQRLVVRASRCGRRTLADRIAFRGATVRPERVDASLGEEGAGVGATLRLALIAAVLLLCLAVATMGRWWGAPS